ncbi:XRE family transcriptional regulator [Sesbania bispinosa]|nr:XRE family transcriptional regulator [Sesbania bispinosa]
MVTKAILQPDTAARSHICTKAKATIRRGAPRRKRVKEGMMLGLQPCPTK